MCLCLASFDTKICCIHVKILIEIDLTLPWLGTILTRNTWYAFMVRPLSLVPPPRSPTLPLSQSWISYTFKSIQKRSIFYSFHQFIPSLTMAQFLYQRILSLTGLFLYSCAIWFIYQGLCLYSVFWIRLSLSLALPWLRNFCGFSKHRINALLLCNTFHSSRALSQLYVLDSKSQSRL